MITNVTAKDKAESYVAGVLDGSIVVGKWVRLAVERYVKDLERQDTPEFPFHLDEAEAEKACRFFPKVLRHSKGEWAGQPFCLEPWQAFILWNIFGWKREDGTRRFRKAVILVARKNGKTQLGAGIAHKTAVADQEAVAEVYCAATKKDQAMVLFDEAERMVTKAPALAKHATCRHHRILFPSTGSKIVPLGSDKPFDGLNPHGIVLDELHAWRDHHKPFYDTMVTASAARRQPLLLVITTEGDTNSKLWINERNYCYGVLQDLYQDETLFAMLYAIDEKDQWDDPSVWVKANPNLGVSVKPEYLAEFCNAARHNSEKRNQFLQYHCNRVVSATEWGIDLEIWNGLAAPLSDWKDAEVITVGFDLGGWDDLAGVAYCARFVDGTEIGEDGHERTSYRYEFKTQAYIYTTSKRDTSKLPWLDWCHSGLVRREEFVIAAIKKQILADHESTGFESVAYDQFNAQQLGEEITAAGIKAVSFRQNFLMYNEPLHNFLSLIERGKIRHDGNPLLTWCAGNLAIKRDSADRWMPCKKSSKDKIDPLVACLMAFRLAMLSPPKPKGNLFVY